MMKCVAVGVLVFVALLQPADAMWGRRPAPARELAPMSEQIAKGRPLTYEKLEDLHRSLTSEHASQAMLGVIYANRPFRVVQVLTSKQGGNPGCVMLEPLAIQQGRNDAATYLNLQKMIHRHPRGMSPKWFDYGDRIRGPMYRLKVTVGRDHFNSSLCHLAQRVVIGVGHSHAGKVGMVVGTDGRGSAMVLLDDGNLTKDGEAKVLSGVYHKSRLYRGDVVTVKTIKAGVVEIQNAKTKKEHTVKKSDLRALKLICARKHLLLRSPLCSLYTRVKIKGKHPYAGQSAIVINYKDSPRLETPYWVMLDGGKVTVLGEEFIEKN